MKISVIGFGYIGAVISAAFCKIGHKVIAIDNNVNVINCLNSGKCHIPEPKLQEIICKQVEKGNLKGSLDFKDVSNCEVVLVTVGTPLSENFDADLTAISDVFFQLSQNIIDDQLIMIKSTVPPGTTRKMYNTFKLDQKNISVGFSPERLAEGNAIKELTELPVIVGGVDDASTEKCAEFWGSTLGVEVIKMSSCESAELVKLANNQWIDLNIALANELALLCDALPYPLDVLEIIEGANSLKKGKHNVNILQPSIGVGGYCLTKDPWFVASLAKKNGLNLEIPRTSRSVNDKMPVNAANVISNFYNKKNINLNDLKIAILGYSFKTNSGDIRFSPMQYFVETMFRKGAKNIHIFDSSIGDDALEHSLAIRSHTWRDCLDGATCVVYGTAHDDIKKILPSDLNELMTGDKLIYDGRRYFSLSEIKELKAMHFDYIGVGR